MTKPTCRSSFVFGHTQQQISEELEWRDMGSVATRICHEDSNTRR
jgi:hypothetical protein